MGNGRGFGQPVAFQNGGAGGLLKAAENFTRQRGRAGNADSNAVQIVAGQILLLQERNVDGRRARKNRGLMAGDDAQHVLRHIARQGQGCGGKGHGNDQAGGQAVDMKEGQQGNKSMVLFGRDVDDVQHLAAVGAQVGMGQRDAFGQTGGAAGILEHDRIVQRVRNGFRMA